MNTLTSNDAAVSTLSPDTESPTATPSPFPRHTIKVYEEPRLREQDIGNYHPSSRQMTTMWHERASYGHFFYRIPNGESAADAYDRISGFNESLWRYFSEPDFASVCVLVTHGLMSRVFLMKWYHFSVEYFEDLRNVDHCEFIVLKLDEKSGKYRLLNDLRTWSQLRREREEKERDLGGKTPESPIPVRKKWGGCFEERCDERKPAWEEKNGLFGDDFARRQARRRGTEDVAPTISAPTSNHNAKDSDDHTKIPKDLAQLPAPANSSAPTHRPIHVPSLSPPLNPQPRPQHLRNASDYLSAGRDGGGSRSGAASPALGAEFLHDSSEEDKPPPRRRLGSALKVALTQQQGLSGDGVEVRGKGEEGVYADALGDQNGGGENDAAKFDLVERMKKVEMSVDGSVR